MLIVEIMMESESALSANLDMDWLMSLAVKLVRRAALLVNQGHSVPPVLRVTSSTRKIIFRLENAMHAQFMIIV